MTTPSVTVLLFARLREDAGTAEVVVGIDEAPTALAAWRAVAARHPRLGAADAPPASCRVAIGERYASWDDTLAAGSVVAFIPPVAGGAPPRVDVGVTAAPLDARALEAAVRSDADGAVCTFSGVVRDHNDGHSVELVEYEAYASMAEAEMRRIGDETLRATGAGAVAIRHRVGALRVGEVSVVVSAAAPHRDEAFRACRMAIDEVKARVPLWKREHRAGGTVWVGDARCAAAGEGRGTAVQSASREREA